MTAWPIMGFSLDILWSGAYFKLHLYPFLWSGSNSGVECQLPKLDVAGSNPVSRSRLLALVRFAFLLYPFYSIVVVCLSSGSFI